MWTIINGTITAAGWVSYVKPPIYFGSFGALGGLHLKQDRMEWIKGTAGHSFNLRKDVVLNGMITAIESMDYHRPQRGFDHVFIG
jgi:hypothetical protein